MQNDEFIDFSKIDADHIEQIRSILLAGLGVVDRLSQHRPKMKSLLYCRQTTEEQLIRVREYEELPFEDRPIGFLDREHQIFAMTCEILAMVMKQRSEVDDSTFCTLGASKGKL